MSRKRKPEKNPPVKYGGGSNESYKKRKRTMNSETRNIEVSVSRSNIEAQIEALLRAVGTVGDKEDVKISFDTKVLKSKTNDIIPLSLEISTKEVTH